MEIDTKSSEAVAVYEPEGGEPDLRAGMLRAAGVPARYVSGYLHPSSSAVIGETVVGQSHAWAEWWLGRWTAFPPAALPPGGRRASCSCGGPWAS
mgnify:CR=1 FL=1